MRTTGSRSRWAFALALTAVGPLALDAGADGCTWREGDISYRAVTAAGEGPIFAYQDGDADGRWEKAWGNIDGNAGWDGEFRDSDDDGDWDGARVDSDGNGWYDQEWIDWNGNGEVDTDEVRKLRPEEEVLAQPGAARAPGGRNCCEEGDWPCPDLPKLTLPLRSRSGGGIPVWGLGGVTLVLLGVGALLLGRRSRSAGR